MNRVIDTTSEMIAGYIAVALLVGGYVLSLWVRGRRVRERLAAIRERQSSSARASQAKDDR